MNNDWLEWLWLLWLLMMTSLSGIGRQLNFGGNAWKWVHHLLPPTQYIWEMVICGYLVIYSNLVFQTWHLRWHNHHQPLPPTYPSCGMVILSNLVICRHLKMAMHGYLYYPPSTTHYVWEMVICGYLVICRHLNMAMHGHLYYPHTHLPTMSKKW